jgi:hypothetical protein
LSSSSLSSSSSSLSLFSPLFLYGNCAFMKLFYLILSKASTLSPFQLFRAFCSSYSIFLFLFCSWSAPLPFTLKIPVQCMSLFYTLRCM